MDVFDLYAKITMDTSEYESGLEGASSKSNSFVSGIKSTLGTVAKVGAAAFAAASTAVAGFAKSSVDAGAQFDTSMSQVAATMGVTTDAIGELRDFAMDMGAKTAFSATQAADALNYMALAGYDADESMSALPTVLNLAAAGGMELATASDMVTDAQSALGLTMDETTEMVDKMAQTASKSNTSVAQLGEAILTVGGTAKNLKGGTTELSTALGILADNGIKGAEGGTHLRNVMLSLMSPTDDAATALDSLGVSVFDANGKMRGLDEIFGDLQSSMSGMTDEAQQVALSTIFNKTDLSAVNALLSNTGERWDELSGYIDDAAGAAEQMANTQLDNLTGDVTLFKSALEGAQIAVSDKLTPSLREFVQFGTDGLTQVTDAFKEGGLSGAMAAFGDVLSEGLTMIVSMLPQAVEAGAQLLGAIGDGIISNLPTIMDAAIQVATMFSSYIIDATPSVISAATQIIASLLDGITSAIPELIPAAIQAIEQIATGLIDNAPMLIDSALQLIVTLGDGIISALPELATRSVEIITSIVDTLTNSVPEIISAGVELLSGLIDAIPTVVGNLVAALPQLITSITSFFSSNVGTIVDAGVTLIGAIVDAIPEVISSLVAALPEIISSVISFFVENAPVILEGAIELFMAIVEAIPEIVVSLLEALPEIFDTIITSIVDSGPDILSSAVDMFMNIVNAIPEFLGSLVEGLGNIGSTIIGWLTGTKSDVQAETDETTSYVVSKYDDMGSGIDSSLSETSSNVSSKFSDIGSEISKSVSSTQSDAETKFSKMADNISSSVDSAKSKTTSGYSDMTGETEKYTEEMAKDIETKYTRMSEHIQKTMDSVSQSISKSLGEINKSSSTGFAQTLNDATEKFNSIKNAISNKLTEAKNSVVSLINQMRSAFNFTWSLPYLRLPHVYIHGRFSLDPPSAPTFSVSWYKKAMDIPMILSGATIFGAMGGNLLGGGESGSEIVAGQETLMSMIREASGATDITKALNKLASTDRTPVQIIINGADYETKRDLAETVAQYITRDTQRRGAALA